MRINIQTKLFMLMVGLTAVVLGAVLLGVLENNIILAGGVSLGATLLLAFFLGRRLSQPILRLVEGMNRVTTGDLNVSLKATTRDEIGLLTNTFNEMIGGLRERLQLMRYVGSHTQEMIHQSSGTEINLGGTRQELAVMFTDIRGFTAFSEKREPEEVISMLNRYLGFQAEIVPQYQGSIDKFVGDEMVALFIGEYPIVFDAGVAVPAGRPIQGATPTRRSQSSLDGHSRPRRPSLHRRRKTAPIRILRIPV